MGLTTCLAYMFIDLERCEVERGYKAVHNPLKGQAGEPSGRDDHGLLESAPVDP